MAKANGHSRQMSISVARLFPTHASSSVCAQRARLGEDGADSMHVFRPKTSRIDDAC